MVSKTNKQSNILIGVLATVIVAVLVVVGIVLWQNRDDSSQPSGDVSQSQSVTTDVVYSGEDGKNALELLRASHDIATETFDGIGEYVISIDGRAADGTHFWALYVDGNMAQVGASEYQTKDGETITWKLDEIK